MPRNPVQTLGGLSTKPLRLWPFVCLALALPLGLALLLSQWAPPVSSQAQFADPTFQSLWERTDGPTAAGGTQRGWVWGPLPGRTLTEPFAGLPSNGHLVQYFDKGTMEINDPNADKKSSFYVTNGLLTVQLISGLEQTGVSTYTNHSPAVINLASDPDDPTAPTYQSFNGVSSIPGAPNDRRAAEAVGSALRTAIDRQGNTQPWPANRSSYDVVVAYYEPSTGHNIPNVFWDFLNQQGKIIQDGQTVQGPLFFPWFSLTGYPISEAYWSYVKVGGAYTDVLIQAYQRRVLTYIPAFQVQQKVQMGNVGQHYYEWRYLSGGTGGSGGAVATPTSQPLPPVANVQINEIHGPDSITNLNNNWCIISNPSQTSVLLDGWWLDSPKWDHVDRFYFPKGISLAPGASLKVHAGRGFDTSTDIYMSRTSAMWDGKPYDLAVLYDNFGRTVSNFFPAAEVGANSHSAHAAYGNTSTGRNARSAYVHAGAWQRNCHRDICPRWSNGYPGTHTGSPKPGAHDKRRYTVG